MVVVEEGRWVGCERVEGQDNGGFGGEDGVGVLDSGGGGVDEVDQFGWDGGEVFAIRVLEDEFGPSGEERHGDDVVVG